MRVAIYCRISTNDDRQSLENQLVPLKGWAERMGASQVLEYVDRDSGSKSDRRGLKRLIEDAHLRRFEVVLIWALDRLSREGIARLSHYLDLFKKHQIRVISHQEPWLDTSGPVTELLTAIFGWIAKQERERIRERIKMGLEAARRKGKPLGRPRRLDPTRVLELRQNGLSLREIGKILGCTKSAVSKTLTRFRQLNR